MADRVEERRGFTLPDVAALVTGAAVASVHLKLAVPEPVGLMEWSWWGAFFVWISLVAAGPFVYLARRFGTKPPGYPRIGDVLWTLAGIPWVISALATTGGSGLDVSAGRLDPAYAGCLTFGLGLTTVVTVLVLASIYLRSAPHPEKPAEPTPWTNRLGLTLAVGWPLQCGVGLIVLS